MAKSMGRAGALLAVCLAGCGPGGAAPDASAPGVLVGTGASVTAMIGADGGSLSLEGVVLTIPPGALDDTQSIGIVSTRELPPAGFVNRSPLYRFEPAGLAFAKPVTVTIPFTGAAADIHLFWTNAAPALGFVDLGAAIAAGAATASVNHFSEGLNAEGCPHGYHNCHDRCVDFDSDPSNCGDCDYPPNGCPGGQVCYQGQCKKLCTDTHTLYCGEPPCKNPLDDELNCGGCGHSCLPGGTCFGGKCVSCASRGLTECPSGCANLQSDIANCGTCGNYCGMDEGVGCIDGQCACNPGYTLCGPNPEPGFCPSLQDDLMNCGACGKTCATGAVCIGGSCYLVCKDGETLCPNGVCTNLDSDAGNCGYCGTQCAAGEHCSNGTCCATGLTGCLGVCVDTTTHPDNCGQCFNHCLRGTCVNGQCTISCGVGLTYCSDIANCVDLQSDPVHCGDCATKCGGTKPLCCGGSCTDGYGDLHNCDSCGTDCTANYGPQAACCFSHCVNLSAGVVDSQVPAVVHLCGSCTAPDCRPGQGCVNGGCQ